MQTVYSYGVSRNEIGLREGRAKFGDLVNEAQYRGKTTIITRHGRPAAMITPVPQHIALRHITVDFIDRADQRDQAIDDWLEAAASEGYGFTVIATYDEGDVLAVVARDDWQGDELAPGERMTLRIDRTGSTVEAGEGDLLGIAPGPYNPEQQPITTITLISAASGDLMPDGAVELAESGIDWADLPEDAQEWANEQGYGADDELLYVIVGEVELSGWPTRTVHLAK